MFSAIFCPAITEEWLQTRLADLEKAEDLSVEKKLEVLAGALKAGYAYEGVLSSEHQSHLSQVALHKMLQIPGHAEYFGDKINNLYANIKQGYADGKDTGEVGWSHYMTESQNAFKTLSMLPSHETVSVLGEMLLDDWKWPDYEKDKLYGKMDTRALSALSKLPIANPPTRPLKTSEDMYEHLEGWKRWHAEIKSGRRTFRFIGDDTEYDLRGPVRRGGGLERDRTARRTPAEVVSENATPRDTPRENRIIPYLVVLLFLAAGLVIYLRGRRPAA